MYLNFLLRKMISFILLSFIVSCTFSQENPSFLVEQDKSMIIRYTFEENSPEIIYDYSIYKNHGLLKGITSNIIFSQISNGVLGNCFNWKNNNTSLYAHIIVNTPSIIHENETGFSISGWIFFQANPSGYHYIITKMKGIDGQRTFFIRMSNATMQFYIYFGYASANNTGITSTALAANAWNHFVCTYRYITNGSSEMKIYINTIQSAASITAGGPLYKSTTPIVIGSDLDTLGNPTANRFRGGTTHGKLDEIRYYNRALSLNEIILMYYSQK